MGRWMPSESALDQTYVHVSASGRSNGGAVLDGLDKGRSVLQVR